MTFDPLLFGTYADAVLDAVFLGLTDKPSKSYVSHGAPSWDCGDQLTVHVGIRPVNPATKTDPGPVRCAVITSLDVTVTLLRCVTALTSDGIPSAEVLDAEGKGLLRDISEIWHVLTSKTVAGDLIPGIACGKYTLRPPQSHGPAGGLAGWSATVEMRITG